MSASSSNSCVDNIGLVSGVVWQVLSKNGPITMAKLVKAAGEPRDTVMQALGWLAREGKVNIVEKNRSRVVSLRP